MTSMARNTAWREQAAKNRQQDEHFLDFLKEFARIRGDPNADADDETFLDNFQNTSAPATHISWDEGVDRVNPGYREFSTMNFEPKEYDQEEFMRFKFSINGTRPDDWRGTKLLGVGSFGYAGLWEYVGSDSVSYENVVVKHGKPGEEDYRISGLDGEHNMYNLLNRANSVHIPRRLAQSQLVQEGEYIGDESVGNVKCLYLEYCPLHSLERLLEMRQARNLPFAEATLWKILHCLVDGMTVLERANEHMVIDKQVFEGEVHTLSNDEKWTPLVHFDVKPDNGLSNATSFREFAHIMGLVLLAEDGGHEFVPIAKIADFGGTESIDEAELPIEDHHLRRRGTEGYWTPEQFSKRWDYKNWKDSGVAGRYSTKTNIWGIGAIMYQLIMNRADLWVDIQKPFKPVFCPNVIGKGLSYAPELKHEIHPAGAYSNVLIHTVWECLYEKPSHRPTLLELKKRIVGVEQDFKPEHYESWENFLVPVKEWHRPASESSPSDSADGDGGEDGGGDGGVDAGGNRGNAPNANPRTPPDRQPIRPPEISPLTPPSVAQQSESRHAYPQQLLQNPLEGHVAYDRPRNSASRLSGEALASRAVDQLLSASRNQDPQTHGERNDGNGPSRISDRRPADRGSGSSGRRHQESRQQGDEPNERPGGQQNTSNGASGGNNDPGRQGDDGDSDDSGRKRRRSDQENDSEYDSDDEGSTSSDESNEDGRENKKKRPRKRSKNSRDEISLEEDDDVMQESESSSEPSNAAPGDTTIGVENGRGGTPTSSDEEVNAIYEDLLRRLSQGEEIARGDPDLPSNPHDNPPEVRAELRSSSQGIYSNSSSPSGQRLQQRRSPAPSVHSPLALVSALDASAAATVQHTPYASSSEVGSPYSTSGVATPQRSESPAVPLSSSVLSDPPAVIVAPPGFEEPSKKALGKRKASPSPGSPSASDRSSAPSIPADRRKTTPRPTRQSSLQPTPGPSTQVFRQAGGQPSGQSGTSSNPSQESSPESRANIPAFQGIRSSTPPSPPLPAGLASGSHSHFDDPPIGTASDRPSLPSGRPPAAPLPGRRHVPRVYPASGPLRQPSYDYSSTSSDASFNPIHAVPPEPLPANRPPWWHSDEYDPQEDGPDDGRASGEGSGAVNRPASGSTNNRSSHPQTREPSTDALPSDGSRPPSRGVSWSSGRGGRASNARYDRAIRGASNRRGRGAHRGAAAGGGTARVSKRKDVAAEEEEGDDEDSTVNTEGDLLRQERSELRARQAAAREEAAKEAAEKAAKEKKRRAAIIRGMRRKIKRAAKEARAAAEAAAQEAAHDNNEDEDLEEEEDDYRDDEGQEDEGKDSQEEDEQEEDEQEEGKQDGEEDDHDEEEDDLSERSERAAMSTKFGRQATTKEGTTKDPAAKEAKQKKERQGLSRGMRRKLARAAKAAAKAAAARAVAARAAAEAAEKAAAAAEAEAAAAAEAEAALYDDDEEDEDEAESEEEDEEQDDGDDDEDDDAPAVIDRTARQYNARDSGPRRTVPRGSSGITMPRGPPPMGRFKRVTGGRIHKTRGHRLPESRNGADSDVFESEDEWHRKMNKEDMETTDDEEEEDNNKAEDNNNEKGSNDETVDQETDDQIRDDDETEDEHSNHETVDKEIDDQIRDADETEDEDSDNNEREDENTRDYGTIIVDTAGSKKRLREHGSQASGQVQRKKKPQKNKPTVSRKKRAAGLKGAATRAANQAAKKKAAGKRAAGPADADVIDLEASASAPAPGGAGTGRAGNGGRRTATPANAVFIVVDVPRVGVSAGTRSRVAAGRVVLDLTGIENDRDPPQRRGGVASGRVTKSKAKGGATKTRKK